MRGPRRESSRKPPLLCPYSAAWFGDEAAEVTFNIGHIAGGSHAGWKRQKPAPREWRCDCWHLTGIAGKVKTKLQPAYMARCPDCGTRRNG